MNANVAPFFTVVIPTYNRGALIRRTLDSVLGQSFRDFEVVVVDNKSEDDTVEVLRPYVESGAIRFLQNERNYERAYSRNRGFELARGRYITLLDSDDILYPDCLRSAHDYAQTHADCRFFHCLYELVDESYRPYRRVGFPAIADPFRRLMEGNFISNIGVFYRYDVVHKVKFDEDPRLIGVEDYDFVIRVLAETRHLGRIEQVNCAIQMHPGRSVLRESLEDAHRRVHYFVSKCVASEAFLRTYGRHVRLFQAHQWLYLCSTAAIRGKTARAIGYWTRAMSARASTLLTRKAWHHLLVVAKYAFV